MYQSGHIRPHFKDGVTAFVLALHVGTKETLNKARLTALYAICLQIFRYIAQKSLAIRQYACGISMQSAEKSDYASYAQALFSVSLIS